MSKNEYKLELNPNIAQYVRLQNEARKSATDEDWLALPELPRGSEICLPPDAKIILPRNKIKTPYLTPVKYLKTHYRLLREDATTPLREAIDKFKMDPQRGDDNDVRIYEQVRVVALTLTYRGIAARVRFSTRRALRRILWSSNKRLTSGTLVGLTPEGDNFRTTCILATVAARPLVNLEVNPPEVDIFFTSTEDIEIDFQRAFTMVEATQGYYEAYRHTLKALQKQSNEKFPLSEHISGLQDQVLPPDYVLSRPVRDLSPAVTEDVDHRLQSVNVIDDWPEAPQSKLDETQWAAMKDILTRKLAIIQGPPGTGKTYVSKVALEILIQNSVAGDPPVIIACQTNHALDQLLKQVNEFDPQFVRLGGRSTEPIVKRRALYEIRKSQVIDNVPGSCFGKARRDFEAATMKIKALLAPLKHDSSVPLSAKALFQLGVISDKQYTSLEKGAEQWVTADGSTQEALQMWLGNAVSNFEAIYEDDTFGFQEAEEDLENEQLRELDAENGVNDEEELEMLKGPFVPLQYGHTISEVSPNTIEEAKRVLDTTQDLYKVKQYLKGPIYMIMRNKAVATMRIQLREAAKQLVPIQTQIQIGRWEKDIVFLQRAKIIGMTTTGLSKYRALISALKPKTILIEEAAEVLEGPVAAACVESLEHLILVGDHQQLQAHCSVRELEGEPYHLNISMFERLVRNKLPHKTLLRQRRMNPDFRELISEVYPGLQDHESVVNRPSPEWGTGGSRSYFFKHTYHELQDEQMSTYNDREAAMIAKFYRHLIRNMVPPAAITVLTFYNGQRKRILRYLKDDEETASAYNIVKTVDSYQGEENYIVLLSLVRSNDYGRIGFLDINNRIVVALSRARFGFYLFGNADFITEHNELWDYVEFNMHQKGRSGYKLPLTCINHRVTTLVQHPEDFDEIDGGCKRRCDNALDCGHPCPLKCHQSDHGKILCKFRCRKTLDCGHNCPKRCSDFCDCECETFQRQLIANQEIPFSHAHERENAYLDGFRKDQPLVSLAHEYVESTERWGQYAHGGSKADDRRREDEKPEDDKQSLRQKGMVLSETQQAVAGSRTRYQHDYQPGSGSQTLVERTSQLEVRDVPAPTAQIANFAAAASRRTSLQTVAGKPKPVPGLDGANESKPSSQATSAVKESVQEKTGSWQDDVDVVDVRLGWLEPEIIAWEAEQKKERTNDYW